MRDAGLPLDPALIYFGEFRQEWGAKITSQILDRVTPLPTALVGGNNFIALGILRALHARGVRVPEEMSVVGFDDLPNYVVTDPWLTVAAQEPYDIGYKAAELLIDFISGDEQPDSRDIMLPVELRIRASCRRISS
jgi:LacI family transcriptional regulator